MMTTHHSKPEEDVNEWGFGPLIIPEDQQQAMGEPRWVPEPLPTADKKTKKRRTGGKRRPPYTARALIRIVDSGGLSSMKTLAEAKIFMVLVRHMRGDFTVTVSRTRLAEQAGISESTVKRTLKTMMDTGAIERTKEGRPDGGMSVYRLIGGFTAMTPQGGSQL